jgi:hypothetical protein
MVVPVETGSTFTHEGAKFLFSGEYTQTSGVPNFDVSSDGKRFLMIRDVAPPIEPSARDDVVVVLNWLEELKRLVPGK